MLEEVRTEDHLAGHLLRPVHEREPLRTFAADARPVSVFTGCLHMTIVQLAACCWMVLAWLSSGARCVAMSGPSTDTSSACARVGEMALFPAYKDGLAGYIDRSGRMVIQPQFGVARRFSEGLAAVARRPLRNLRDTNRRYVFEVIDTTGKTVIPGPFDAALFFCDGLAVVRQDGKCGYLKRSGDFLISPRFEYAGDFSEGLGIVRSEGKCGVIDKTGNFVLTPQYAFIREYHDGLALFKPSESDKLGYLDRDGKVAIPPTFSNAYDFSEELAYAQSGGTGGYIDKTGKFVIPPRFTIGGPFRGGLAAINGPGFGYFIDRSGQIPKQFHPSTFVAESVGNFSDGLAAVQRDGKWGFVDVQGCTLISPKWESVEEFCNGVARVSNSKGRFNGYINKKGEYIWSATLPSRETPDAPSLPTLPAPTRPSTTPGTGLPRSRTARTRWRRTPTTA